MRDLIAAAMFLLAIATCATAADGRVGPILVQQPWARELPPVSTVAAAYLSVHNSGTQPDRLLAAATPAASRVEIHTHEHSAGMMRMRQIDGVDLLPGQRVSFEPGGLHLMLIDVQRPLIAGQGFALTLTFQHAGSVQVQVEVRKDAPPAPGGHAGHGQPRH